MVQAYKDITKVQKDAKKVAEIADIIRHAKLGSDVREARARGFETIDDSEVINHLISEVDNLIGEIIGYRDDVKNLNSTVQKLIDAVQKSNDDNQNSIYNVAKKNQEAIQKALDDNQSKLDKFNIDWQNKIDRIILGTDEPTLERIIDEKLNERGV